MAHMGSINAIGVCITKNSHSAFQQNRDVNVSFYLFIERSKKKKADYNHIKCEYIWDVERVILLGN